MSSKYGVNWVRTAMTPRQGGVECFNSAAAEKKDQIVVVGADDHLF